MANYSAADVKKLRDATGAGMMDCKKALDEADGDYERAVEVLRVKGEAKAAKRADERTAANGLVAAAEGAMIELASETDFVAKNEQFQTLANDIVAHFASSSASDLDSLKAETLKDGKTVADSVEGLAAVIGEKLELRRAVKLDGQVATYLHRKASDLPPQVGVLVAYDGSDADAARGAAMQVAALRARYLTRDDVPAEDVEAERRVLEEKTRAEGKPEQAVAKIVDGRLNAFYADNVLLEQESVREAKQTVKQVLDAAGVTVTRFAHFEVGSA
ncbi:translation elongation factor Ts (EF-Ts) [Jatrophihabitans endophyticus]|uniref:Elongation factor Ts n=1 Tax=Jatrophihabitans endophyticus TaxID=1206085 RepID=A0A1M5CBU5_9ACTN|nr:translation elongation factor Ts [Jatrophihabitans endophyticus]SHF52181.1 translation elongation factor Ts (EF-Ts) [Jatrophihabitans endophyticus]